MLKESTPTDDHWLILGLTLQHLGLQGYYTPADAVVALRACRLALPPAVLQQKELFPLSLCQDIAAGYALTSIGTHTHTHASRTHTPLITNTWLLVCLTTVAGCTRWLTTARAKSAAVPCAWPPTSSAHCRRHFSSRCAARNCVHVVLLCVCVYLILRSRRS